MRERILKATHEVERGLFFTTAIMVCAFVPLFTMQGPEGQIFGPMADTYAFALCGALFLALTMAPVMCLLCFKNLKAAPDNWLVRGMKARYLRNLRFCLRHPYATVGVMAALTIFTTALLPLLGREFMPALEEGNLWIRGTAPLNISLPRHTQLSAQARAIMATYPEVESIVNQLGRPDDATDTDGYYNSEYFVPLRPEKDWPLLVERPKWQRWILGAKRARTKDEIVDAMNAELGEKLPGITWNFSQNIRDNVMEALSGIKGDNSVKIFGPDLDRLELLAAKAKNVLQQVRGIENVGIFHIRGQSHLEWRVDPSKCQRWGVQTADVNNVVTSASGAGPVEHGRRRKTFRHLGPLAQAAAEQRSRHPRHPGRHHQQQRRAEHGPGRGPDLDRHRQRDAVQRRSAGQHREHHQQHAAASAPRPGFAGRRGRRPAAGRPISSSTAPRRSIANRASG